MTLPPFAVLMAGRDDTQSLLLDVEGKFDNVNLVVGGVAGFLGSFTGGFGGLTPLFVLATALVTLLDFLAAFPEFFGGLLDLTESLK